MDQEKLQQQNEESEPSNEGVETTPVVVFDGKCKHLWYMSEIDSEGYGRARCKKCPMGKIFNPKNMEVKSGRIISK